MKRLNCCCRAARTQQHHSRKRRGREGPAGDLCRLAGVLGRAQPRQQKPRSAASHSMRVVASCSGPFCGWTAGPVMHTVAVLACAHGLAGSNEGSTGLHKRTTLDTVDLKLTLNGVTFLTQRGISSCPGTLHVPRGPAGDAAKQCSSASSCEFRPAGAVIAWR